MHTDTLGPPDHCCCPFSTATPAATQRPRKAFPVELAQFHSEDYVDFLSKVTPDNVDKFQQQLKLYNFNDDCPVFEGMFK